MPEAGPGELLVKVNACGICGSDVVEWYRLPRAPLVQGHEIGLRQHVLDARTRARLQSGQLRGRHRAAVEIHHLHAETVLGAANDAEDGEVCGVANDNAPGQVGISGHQNI